MRVYQRQGTKEKRVREMKKRVGEKRAVRAGVERDETEKEEGRLYGSVVGSISHGRYSV